MPHILLYQLSVKIMVSIPTQAAVTAANPSETSEENVRYTPTNFFVQAKRV